ncbi:MAG: CheR family methyltransferase [Dehalococcoidia bacterium]
MSSTSRGSRQDLEDLLLYLMDTRGFDFGAYKRTTLSRRIAARMQALNVDTYRDYLELLEADTSEFGHLFNTILINVTDFFRDQEQWKHLADEIVPQVLEAAGPDNQVRVWSAGCASGQEAYTLGMIFCEAMGVRHARGHLKIYATDVDEEALHEGRQSRYTADQVKSVPADLLKKYFDNTDGGSTHTVNRDLRRLVIFGRNDLVQDPPISKLHLIACRNTLMYFNADVQTRVLSRFHFALNGAGTFLFLGKAEVIGSRSDLFIPVNLGMRIFAPVSASNTRQRLLHMAQAGRDHPSPGSSGNGLGELRKAALGDHSIAEIILDESGALVFANQQARTMFGLDDHDVGQPFRDLELSYRPLELRSRIDHANAERQPVTIKAVEWWPLSAQPRYMDVRVTPLIQHGGDVLGTKITFVDVTEHKRTEAELEQAREKLQQAYEELQAANEELESSNEELQSAGEEMETTNEELQSTNEELETMNEELQSTIEELNTVNAELQARTSDLNRANAFLQSILSGLSSGLAVVNHNFVIEEWNQGAEELWGLRFDEARGQNLLTLEIGLPVQELTAPVKRCLAGEGPLDVRVDAVDRLGRQLRCRVMCTPLVVDDEVDGVILVMEHDPERRQPDN